MCVILERKPGQKIDPEVVEACYQTNPHGFGIAWYDGTKVRITKGVKDLSSIQALIKGLQNYLSLIHFRWATVGEKVKENCHPFYVGVNGAAMVHNGSFPTRPRKTKNKTGQELQWSDTKEIAHVINSWSEEIIRRSLGKFKEWHGEGNRTAFLLSNGEILRTGSWHEHDGMTCSNLNWKVRNYRTRKAGEYQPGTYYVNGKKYGPGDDDDMDSALYGMYGGNTHRTSGSSNYRPTWKENSTELKLSDQNPNEFIKVGQTWISRREAEEKELEKKGNNALSQNSNALSALGCTTESHQKTDSVQSVSLSTVENQASGQTGTENRHLIKGNDEVVRSELSRDHFKVIINVFTKKGKTFSIEDSHQKYMVYYWDFERKDVRCEYYDDDLDNEIAVWKKTGMTIHLTELFDGRGKQRIISGDRHQASQA